MANQFVNLPVPVGDGVGTAVDMTTFGASKSIVVGGNATAQITIEFNNDAAQGGTWAALKTFQNNGDGVFDVACRWMRVRVSGYNYYAGGTPNVDVGGDDAGTLFFPLVAPADSGVGAAVDTTTLGLFKTVQVGGAFRGMTLVEVSEDGTDWGQPFAFQTPGFKSLPVTAQFMRVKRVGVPQVAPGLPIITVGACEFGGGGGGGAIVQAFRYTVTGLEPDLSDFFIPLPVAQGSDSYTVTIQQAGMAFIVGLDAPDVAAGDRTTTQFRVVSTFALTAGDQLDILIGELT